MALGGTHRLFGHREDHIQNDKRIYEITNTCYLDMDSLLYKLPKTRVLFNGRLNDNTGLHGLTEELADFSLQYSFGTDFAAGIIDHISLDRVIHHTIDILKKEIKRKGARSVDVIHRLGKDWYHNLYERLIETAVLAYDPSIRSKMIRTYISVLFDIPEVVEISHMMSDFSATKGYNIRPITFSTSTMLSISFGLSRVVTCNYTRGLPDNSLSNGKPGLLEHVIQESVETMPAIALPVGFLIPENGKRKIKKNQYGWAVDLLYKNMKGTQYETTAHELKRFSDRQKKDILKR